MDGSSTAQRARGGLGVTAPWEAVGRDVGRHSARHRDGYGGYSRRRAHPEEEAGARQVGGRPGVPKAAHEGQVGDTSNAVTGDGGGPG